VIISDISRYLRPGLPQTTFCPGCGHGIILNALLRAIDSLGLEMRKIVFVSGIGCAAWIPSPHINGDTLHTLHGRAIAAATGVKLANPELTVIVVSGDGDLSSIGGNHLIHAARRAVPLTVLCADNQIYGMTGGQTAATTPLEAITTTNPLGNPYRPFDLVKLTLAAGAAYAARWPVTRPIELTRAIKRAITTPAFSFVDIMSPCPTHYGRMNKIPGAATGMHQWMDELCTRRAEAEAMEPAERARRIVVGEWTDA
jgi:2-oxoglutarate ferredoxin oxidoreductase subunit beta